MISYGLLGGFIQNFIWKSLSLLSRVSLILTSMILLFSLTWKRWVSSKQRFVFSLRYCSLETDLIGTFCKLSKQCKILPQSSDAKGPLIVLYFVFQELWNVISGYGFWILSFSANLFWGLELCLGNGKNGPVTSQGWGEILTASNLKLHSSVCFCAKITTSPHNEKLV